MSLFDRLSRRSRDQELDEEIQAHLAMSKYDRIERGDSPQTAELAARREFGNAALISEVTREMWGWSSVERLWQDVHYALRAMRRAPAFTVVVVLSLALGTGANTAIFSLINAVMLRTLPVHEPQQLVELLNKYPGEPRGNYFSLASYEHYRDHNHVFSDITGTSSSRFHLRGVGVDPEIVDGEFVTGNFFSALGVRPAVGRLVSSADDHLGAAESAVAVVSWSFWKNRFDQKPGILGKQIIVEDVPVTIIGVTSREFFGEQVGFSPDIWLPLSMEPVMHPQNRNGRGGLRLIGRLKPGVSFEQARAEMSVLYQFTINERYENSHNPLTRQLRFEMEPAATGLSLLRDQFSKPLLILMAVVGILLVISCINVAGMLLARGAVRQREMAVRVSLGAGRFRLVRQVLTESLLLAGMGTLLGVFLAFFGADALLRILASGRQIPGLPVRIDVQLHPDVRVLVFTAGIAVLTGVLFGLAPAYYAFASAPASFLREVRGAGETRSRRLFAWSLVVAQVALSLVLLSAAALFVGHLSNLEKLDLGFHRDHVLLVNLDPARSGLTGERLSHAYRELLARFEVLPGVRSATLSTPSPLSGAGASSFAIVEGYQEKPEDRRYIAVSWVAPKYFETLGMPLLIGRDFRFEDQVGPRVAIINQAMARYYFGNGDPIGKHVALERDWKGFSADQPYEIVGVVGDAKYTEVRESPPRTIYFNAFQEGHVSSQFALRTNVEPTAVAPAVRQTVRELLDSVPITRVTTLADQVDSSMVADRLVAALSGFFGALGSLLAAIGLYGLLTYTVTRRFNEIGVRMALGATRSDVARMVLADAARMVGAGLLIGVPIAFWGKRLAASLVQDQAFTSGVPVAFGLVAMISLALMAAWLPVNRASCVDPTEALRHE